MTKIDVSLISGRTIQQGIGLEVGKTSDRYLDSVSQIYVNQSNLDTMGVQEGEAVEVCTPYGSVVVYCRVSAGLGDSVAFFPYGLWSNQVFGSSTKGTGMPLFKGLKAELKPADGKDVLSLFDLVQKIKEDAG